MTPNQVADIKAHAGDGFGPSTIVALCDVIEHLNDSVAAARAHLAEALAGQDVARHTTSAYQALSLASPRAVTVADLADKVELVRAGEAFVMTRRDAEDGEAVWSAISTRTGACGVQDLPAAPFVQRLRADGYQTRG